MAGRAFAAHSVGPREAPERKRREVVFPPFLSLAYLWGAAYDKLVAIHASARSISSGMMVMPRSLKMRFTAARMSV